MEEPGTLSNYDDDGSEDITKKKNLRPFKLYRVYLEALNSSNVGDFSWSLILKGFIYVQIEKGKIVVVCPRFLCLTCSPDPFFFSLPHTFTLVAASISLFLTAATKLSCCSSNKKMSPLLFSLPLALCRFLLACRLLSLFLCLCLSLYSKKVDVTINLNLIL